MTEAYKKEDYLNATNYAKTVGEKVSTVKKAMHLAELKGATIKVNTVNRQIVTPLGTNSILHVRPEPAAHELLNEYIAQIKTKGTTK